MYKARLVKIAGSPDFWLNKTDMEPEKTQLRDHGLKATPGRTAIYRVLENEKGAITPQVIAKRIPKGLANVSTVYRALQDFVRAGLVRQVPTGKYELATLPHHHHLVCVSCGNIEDIEVCNVEKIEKHALEGASNFTEIIGHSLDFFGRCKTCA